MCINYAVIDNHNYGSLQELVLLFEIPIEARKNFFEIYWEFWHAPSKVSPALVYIDGRLSRCVSFLPGPFNSEDDSLLLQHF
jgi:hypothetical protein